jgi:hypothetical protein
MNATTLVLPSWTTEIQRYSQKAIFYTPIVFNAFNETLAPVFAESIKGLTSHWFETECYWRERMMNVAGITHNPITASVSATYSELTSTEAQATYSHIRHIIRETATDALIIGLCGVVAIAEGIEFGMKVYSQVKAAYTWVDAKLNPAGPAPVILPTVAMAIAHTPENAIATIIEKIQEDRQLIAKFDQLDSDALATVQAKAEEAITQATIAQLKTARAALMFREECDWASREQLAFVVGMAVKLAQAEVSQPNGFGDYIPVTGSITNPEPTDMHQENIRMVAESAPTDDKAVDVEDIASALLVPGAEGKRKRNASRNQPKPKAEDAQARNTPKRRRTAANK